ncbi:MAG TPA: site-specific integrase [Rhodanobacteraceae bacterium]|nr:site-specific integrase [Rhodanobacteraceae bacterium]
MARQSIDRAGVRSRLKPRREPYWGPLVERGLYLGFRKLELGGTWIARQRDEDGRQRYKSLGQVDLMPYEEALKGARGWAKSLAEGIDPGDVESVEEACRAYVAELRLEKRDPAATDAEGRFNRTVYGKPFGKIKLLHLRTAKIKEWRSKLAIADASKNRTLSALKAALNTAVSNRRIDSGRAIEWQQVKPLPVSGRRDVYLDAKQRRRLIDHLPDELQALMIGLYLTAVRPGALAEAKVEDLDQKHSTLFIRAFDKGHGQRTISLSAEAAALFRKAAKGKLPLAPLIAYPDGSHWHKKRWDAPVRAAVKAAKLPAKTVAYSLRHSAITDLLNAGVDPLTVCKQAGTSMVMLEKHYGHLLHKHATKSMAALTL